MNLQLLLVEDNPGDVRLFEECLREEYAGVTVHAVPDSIQALHYLERRGLYHNACRPDLIVLDLNLPCHGSLHLITTVKAHPHWAVIPLIVLTTSSAAHEVRAAYQAHANAFMVKPSSLTDFTTSVRSFARFWLMTATLPSEHSP